MSQRKAIFKDALIFTGSSYGAQLFDVVNGVLMRNFLGPANMGLWSLLQIIQNYAKYAGLGAATSLARDVPYLLGKGNLPEVERIKDQIFTFTMTMTAVVALGVLGFALFQLRAYGPDITWGLLTVACLILLQRVYNFHVVLLRAYKQFVFAGKLNIGSSMVTLALTVALVWPFKLYGLFAAVVLHYFVLIGLILYRTPYRFGFDFNWQGLRPVLNFGMAMVISGMLRTLMMSIDRIMIAKFLSFESLGLYSIALMATNYLYMLPNMVGIVFFPHLQEVFSRRDDKNDLEKFMREPALCLAFLFPFLIGFVAIFSAWLVPILMPQYVSGLPSLQILVLGAFFLALTHPFSQFMVTVRLHWQLIPLQALIVAAGFLATWIAMRLHYGIEGVAWAMLILYLAYFMVLSLISLREIRSLRFFLSFYAKILSAFLLSVAALKLSAFLFAGSGQGLVIYILHFLVYCLIVSPLLWWAEKEVRFLSTLKSFFASKAGK